MVPAEKGDFAKYEASGVEDPRITFIDGKYLITYSAYSRHGVRITLPQNQFEARFQFRIISAIA
jgi:predicted GH43/DUF377 family glycosyl hydrolase